MNNIADYLAPDDPALIAWIAACDNCPTARALRVMAELDQRIEQRAKGESDE